MTEREYEIKRAIKLKEIERNERIHCYRVADRHRRELAVLEKEYITKSRK